jgi:hypothetical protein
LSEAVNDYLLIVVDLVTRTKTAHKNGAGRSDGGKIIRS